MVVDKSKPIVGISTAFTGKYVAVKLLIRFLELMDIPMIKSTVTKPNMIEAASAIASADYCLPLRVYIGHIYQLIHEHPEIDVLLTPIIKGEHDDSSTCAKYRDLDGVVIRSLSSITGYRLKQSNYRHQEHLNLLMNEEIVERLAEKGDHFPRVIAPEIDSLDENHLRQVCAHVYGDLFQWKKAKKLAFLMKRDWSDSRNDEFKEIDQVFKKAYQDVIEKQSDRYLKLLKDPTKVRLALVGRNYLVEDSALSADVKIYFTKKGVSVITMQDLPFWELQPYYQNVNGFYDTHRLGQAFIDKMIDHVDGFILVGSFGCHPDAFQVEYFAKYISDQGKACWTFKFDEQTGGVGFHTRYETILGFLQQKRDERIQKLEGIQDMISHISVASKPVTLKNEEHLPKEKKPLFIWPYMGDGIGLILKDIWHQLGLSDFLYPPKPVNEETIIKGNVHYTETCSPFALSMGSIRQTLDRVVNDLEEQANIKGGQVEPRRIIILMARGKGPCTFGWYAIAGEPALLKEYQPILQKYGHTLEMFTLDNEGRNLLAFLQQVSTLATHDRLAHLVKSLEQFLHKQELNVIQAMKVQTQLLKMLKNLVWPGWEKLLAYEDLQNKALIVRAHETKRGTTTQILRKWIRRLDEVHTIPEILQVKEKALKELEQIEQDQEIKPKVVVVGEIYVSLTSFANRGTVDNLLGMLGIEAVEGMRLSHFIRGAFKGLKAHFIQKHPLLKPILQGLTEKGLYSPNRWVREPMAKPFLEHEVGGDGQPTVAHARHHIEHDGVDGIVHLYPFKCMPEGMAKDALAEMCQIYGIKSIHLSFDKEIEIERLKTEINTFASLLHQEIAMRGDIRSYREEEIQRRQQIGHTIEKVYQYSK
ncbi:acyl-CoA dehydratase activase-related protein [Tepidibacillus sp. HK-1]|uniref:acyl-CoA dehydratase activase-related protein n=1 Tax=Tepidibacillus sp. HK-1 TaxID=1883407 RepID=UPI0008531010|nr:acyl-CoA dehydratase activase-related protein [Tepidibacillus sp. HK-1]GBF10615.1 hypothetical protein HK1_00627 [Tepidibacillus sp. HK-1]